MTTYRVKPPTVEAIQWLGDNLDEVLLLYPGSTPDEDGNLLVPALMSGVSMGATMVVPLTCWITRDLQGNTNYIDDALFQQTYEEVTIVRAPDGPDPNVPGG